MVKRLKIHCIYKKEGPKAEELIKKSFELFVNTELLLERLNQKKDK